MDVMNNFEVFTDLRVKHNIAAEPVDMFKNCPEFYLNKY